MKLDSDLDTHFFFFFKFLGHYVLFIYFINSQEYVYNMQRWTCDYPDTDYPENSKSEQKCQSLTPFALFYF